MSGSQDRLVLMFSSVFIFACGPAKLEREQALDQLRRSEHVAKVPPLTTRLPRDGALNQACLEQEDLANLEEKGLLSYAMEKRGYYFYCTITLTPKGERELRWKAIEQPRGIFMPSERFYEIPLYIRTPAEITGIATSSEDDSRALVEFTWRLEPTLSARAIAASSSDPEVGAMVDSINKVRQRGTAQMRRFDDGWRVESVEVPR